MKKIILIFSFILITNNMFAQVGTYYTGAEASYLMPIGSLNNLFKSTYGATTYLGYQTTKTLTWLGKLEYYKYEDENYSKLQKKANVIVGSKEKVFSATLNDLRLSLEVVGLNANAKINLIKMDDLDVNIDLGMGIYRWLYKRSGYDSLMVDTSSNSAVVKRYIVLRNTPSQTQQDWSSGFNAGIEFDIKATDDLSFTLAANYKNMVAELWQSLSLDIENVSTVQMLDCRVGVRYRF